jgi:hypothetical protein
MRSVKGASHLYRHHSLPETARPALPPPEDDGGDVPAPAAPASNPEVLAKFHDFVCARPSAAAPCPPPVADVASSGSAAEDFKTPSAAAFARFMSATSPQPA